MSDGTQSQLSTFFIADRDASPTHWRQIGGVKDFTGPGGKTTIIDKSDLNSTFKEKLPGLPDEGTFTLTCAFISGDVGQKECLNARTQRIRSQFKVVVPAGSQAPAANPSQSMYFFGYVTGYTEKGGVDKLIEASIDIEIDGAVTRI